MNIGSNYLTTGEDKSRRYGTAHPSIVPYQAFECRDGTEIMICVGSDQQFREFCRGIGIEESADDEKFKSNSVRVQNREELISRIADIFKTGTRDTWLKRFDGLRFPYGPVRSVKDAFEDPQAQHRKMTTEIDHPKCGAVRMAGPPVKYSRTPSTVRNAPPLLGQHTTDILNNLLRLSSEEIDVYHRDQVVETYGRH